MVLRRRNEEEKKIDNMVKEVINEVESPLEPVEKASIRCDMTVSTGSTLVDLCISGGRTRKGGIPGGIIVEIFGPSGSGKTGMLAEIAESTKIHGGETKFLDPEARLDTEYARTCGMIINPKEYYRPKLVSEVFEHINSWNVKNPGIINTVATDSLAALSTELEMEKGDKMGMKRAKSFSEGLRVACKLIADKNLLIACSNQVRDGEFGEVTPGGQAIPFYASLRIRTAQIKKIEKEIAFGEKKKIVKKVIGIESSCYIRKNSIDDPFRTCNFFLLFGYGIDDTRGCVQYIKDMTGNTIYECPDGKTYQAIDKAIFYIEENNLVEKLKNNVIDLWNEIEEKFKTTRNPKIRI